MTALGLALRAAEAAGLDLAGAGVLRARTSTLVHLPAARVLARVEAPAGRARAAQQWELATFWAGRGAPVAPLVPGSEVFEDGEGAVTLWQWMDTRGGPIGAVDHGRLLRALHASTEGSLPPKLPRMDIEGEVRFCLDGARGHLAESSWLSLRDTAAELCRRPASRGGPVVAVHGDPHRDNILLCDGGPVFVDLELSGVGPRAWDAAVLDVQVRRFGVPATWWSSFVSGYGSDPRTTPGYEDLVRLYEIQIVAWACAAGATDPALAEEGQRRLASIDGATEYRWRQF